MLFGATFAGSRLRETFAAIQRQFRYLSLTVVLAALFVAALFTWRLVAAAPDGRLHVTFLDVGSADAVLIQTPAGRHVLINGGPSAASLPMRWAGGSRPSTIAWIGWCWLRPTRTRWHLCLACPRFPPVNVLLAAPAQASFSSGALVQWLTDESVPVTQAEQGQALDLGDGARLRVLSLSPRGATLLVEWNQFHLLLPIGEDLDTRDQLENTDVAGPVDVLLLAQSGYAPLTPPFLIQNLNPQLAVISVAAGDKDGLPDQAMLDALKEYSVLRTDQHGWIEVTTDGKQMWITSER